MVRIDTATARRQLADLVSRVRYAKERITLTRYGKAFAALVPIEDLQKLKGKARAPVKVRRKGSSFV